MQNELHFIQTKYISEKIILPYENYEILGLIFLGMILSLILFMGYDFVKSKDQKY